MKVICSVKSDCFLVAMINDQSVVTLDTDHGHCSFVVFGIEPEEFADAISDLYQGWENREHVQHITLRASRVFDTIHFVREGAMVSVNRGNIKTLYFENIHNLMCIVKPLLKASEQYRAKCNKEMNDDSLVV